MAAERIVMDRVGSACPIPPAFFGDTIEVDGDASYVWSRRRSGEGGRSWPGWPPWYGEAVGSTAVATLEEQFIGGFTQTGAILFRKDAWTKMGGILRTPHIAPGEDFDLMLRLLDLGGCVAIRTPIVLYTSWVGHAGSVSDQYTSCWGGDKEAYEAWHHHLRSFVRFRRIASGRPDLRCCYDSNWQAHPVENAATIAKE